MSEAKNFGRPGRPKSTPKPIANQPRLSFSMNAFGEASLSIGAPVELQPAPAPKKTPSMAPPKGKELPPLNDQQQGIVDKLLPQRGRKIDKASQNGIKALWLSLDKNKALLLRHLAELPIWKNRNLSRRGVYKMLKKFENPTSKKPGVQVIYHIYDTYAYELKS